VQGKGDAGRDVVGRRARGLDIGRGNVANQVAGVVDRRAVDRGYGREAAGIRGASVRYQPALAFFSET
jgi:hypothetical protein